MVTSDDVPVYLYHGTRRYPFKKFTYQKGFPRNGFFFTHRPNVASGYAKGGHVLRVKLHLKNPAHIRPKEEREFWFSPEQLEELKSQGHDGAIIHKEDGSIYEYIAFDGDSVEIIDSRKLKDFTDRVRDYGSGAPHSDYF